jgi:hypothetical protein
MAFLDDWQAAKASIKSQTKPTPQPESTQALPDPHAPVPVPPADTLPPTWATIHNIALPPHISATLEHLKNADGLKGKMAAFRNLTHLAWKETGKGKPLTRDETMQFLCVTDPQRIEEFATKYAAPPHVKNGLFRLILKSQK